MAQLSLDVGERFALLQYETGIVLPHLISGQFVEHCKLSFVQRIQPAPSLHFLRDIQAHSLVTLVRDLRLSSAAMGLE